MKQITIVTGNAGKVEELRAIAMGKLDFSMKDLDIDEIQSLDIEKIVKNKAEQAYALVGGPVIVDDVSAGLDSLNGLPGPFIKYFNAEAGSDVLFRLSSGPTDKVTVVCMAAFYDGEDFILGRGELVGSLVSPRGNNGFGFDSCIVPDGQTKTMAEMTSEEKMSISHRGKAFRDLLSKLDNYAA